MQRQVSVTHWLPAQWFGGGGTGEFSCGLTGQHLRVPWLVF